MKLRDAGATLFTIYTATVLVLGAANWLVLNAINSKWPPISIAQKSRQAVGVAAAGLNQFQSGAFTLHLASADIATPIENAIASAVASYQKSNPNSELQVTNISTSFDNQLVSVSFDFTLPVSGKNLLIRGSATGLAFVAVQGDTVTIIPAIQRIKIAQIKGSILWIFHPSVALIQGLLNTFMANINGAIPAVQKKIPIAPLTLPGQPANTKSASVSDPLHPGQTISVSVTAPILGASAILIDPSGVTLMGDLRIDGAAPRPPAIPPLSNPTFAQYSVAFHTVAANSGVAFAAPSSFVVSQTFTQGYFNTYLLSIDAAGAIDKAVQQSALDLANLGTPTTGLKISGRVITGAVSSAIDAKMPSWLNKMPGSTASPAQSTIGGQAITAAVGAHVVFPQGSIDGKLVGAVAPTGGIGQFTVRPAIDGISVSNVVVGDYSDLNGMLIGVNTLLAAAAQAVNAQISPLVVPINGLGLDTIDLQKSAPSGVTITPPSITLPAAVLADAAVLVDDSGLKVMARLSTDTTAPAAAPPAHETFDQFRQGFMATWSQAMPGGGAAPSDASVYQAESSIADYVNKVWPASGISVVQSSSFQSPASSTDLKLDMISTPNVSCNFIKCDYHCGTFNIPCKAAEAVCTATKLAELPPCEAAKLNIDLIIAALNPIITNLKGTFSSSIRGTESAGLHLKPKLAEDFSSVTMSGSVGATASVTINWGLQPKSLGHLVCIAPAGGSPSWSGSASIPNLPNFKSAIAPYAVDGRTGFSIALTSDPFAANAALSMPPLNNILPDLADIGIDCPLVGLTILPLLTLVDGAANIDRYALQDVLHAQAGASIWSIITGQVAVTVPSMTYNLNLPPPQFNVGATTLKGSLAQSGGWLQGDFVQAK